MFTIEKIKAVPNPAIPQWRVYDQARSLTLSVRILKSNTRAWCLYAERWKNNQWTLVERVGERERQAAAYCEAGAWIERAGQSTGSPAQEDTFEEAHWREHGQN